MGMHQNCDLFLYVSGVIWAYGISFCYASEPQNHSSSGLLGCDTV